MMSDYLIGRSVRSVFEEVLRAKRAYVISPWIQEPYASRLLAMAREGRALVITSASPDNALYRLITQSTGSSGLMREFLLWISILALVIGPLLAIEYLIPGILITILGVLGLLLRRRIKRQKPIVGIRLCPGLGQDGFIHAKLYIADDKAWVGSANMTISAWRHNIEVLVPIPVEMAREIFEALWRRAEDLS